MSTSAHRPIGEIALPQPSPKPSTLCKVLSKFRGPWGHYIQVSIGGRTEVYAVSEVEFKRITDEVEIYEHER